MQRLVVCTQRSVQMHSDIDQRSRDKAWVKFMLKKRSSDRIGQRQNWAVPVDNPSRTIRAEK
jgi:hypothetical protein